MRIHHLGRLTPELPGVLEGADQFFFLGVHADHGLSRRLLRRALGQDLRKLLVARRMLLARHVVAVGPQPVALIPEQAPKDRLADARPTLVQLLTKVAQAAIEPFLLAHRVTRRMRRDDGAPDRYEGRLFFSACGRPPPGRRWRLGGWAARSPASSRRPSWIGLGARPVMHANSLMGGACGASAKVPTYQRR